VKLFGGLFVFFLGFAAGGWVFHDTQPRTWLTVKDGKVHASQAQLLGYLGSAIMHRAPGVIPDVVMETDKSIAMKYPVPGMDKDHYVIVPKRDIRDVSQLAKGDEASLIDAFAVIGKLARQTHMDHYKVVTYSPAEQDVGYLHFHLVKVNPKERKFPLLRKPAPDTTPND
jgi:diadenosine tetraphosphate (Ap4A) HIT family hydrolase